MKDSFSALRQFVRKNQPLERCELCSKGLGEVHSHLLQPANRQLLCACEPCAILFSESQESKYKRVPYETRYLSDFQMTDGQWESLMLPISMAFFFYSSPEQKIVALYPSPAGATESLLRLESWSEILEKNPVLNTMRPDVEALLVNRIGSEHQYFLAPIDQCFKLVGLIRLKWRGLSGGNEVWQELYKFFEELKNKSRIFETTDKDR